MLDTREPPQNICELSTVSAKHSSCSFYFLQEDPLQVHVRRGTKVFRPRSQTDSPKDFTLVTWSRDLPLIWVGTPNGNPELSSSYTHSHSKR